MHEPRAGFIIHVLHEDDRDRLQPIVQKHLHALMVELLDTGIVDPAIDCGPWRESSAGTLSEEGGRSG